MGVLVVEDEKPPTLPFGDVGDLTGGGRTALLCELEQELKQGSEEALSAFARALMDTYHLSEQPLSKLQRARALAE